MADTAGDRETTVYVVSRPLPTNTTRDRCSDYLAHREGGHLKPLIALVLGLMVWPVTQGYAEVSTNSNPDQTSSLEIATGFLLPKPSGWIDGGSRTTSRQYEVLSPAAISQPEN